MPFLIFNSCQLSQHHSKRKNKANAANVGRSFLAREHHQIPGQDEFASSVANSIFTRRKIHHHRWLQRKSIEPNSGIALSDRRVVVAGIKIFPTSRSNRFLHIHSGRFTTTIFICQTFQSLRCVAWKRTALLTLWARRLPIFSSWLFQTSAFLCLVVVQHILKWLILT